MLRNQNKELEKLRVENQRLTKPAASARSQADKPATETPAEDTFPKEAWAFAGYATPEAALQSASWAMKNGDVKAFFASMTPETQKQAEKELEGKSESEIAARNLKEMDTITGYRILKRTNVS